MQPIDVSPTTIPEDPALQVEPTKAAPSFDPSIHSLRGRLRSLWNAPNRAWSPWVLGLLLALAIFLVYSNTFHGPFQYDDGSDVRENMTIRHLWPLRDVFFIHGSGFMTRPVTNLTFAINYAIGGLKPFSYHLTNLSIHICASLALLGIIRRTLSLPRLRDRFSGHIPTLSLITAALWALHPLLTESVSYITQRYESLMGMFVLLTFYCVLRMAEDASPLKWATLASMSCLLALGSKEVAVTVPILVLLFDRTFLAGSFRGAWRKRRVLYLGLMVAWACFAFIQFGSAGKRGFAGFGLDTPWWRYALNQPNVILYYLRLALWPHPLNFDYFWPLAKSWGQLVPGFLAIGALLGLTLWALFRRPEIAFLSVFFFFILAPTSSVMPILDLAVEHRMYLPLVPVVVFIVFAMHWMSVKFSEVDRKISTLIRLTSISLVACTLSAFGALTYLRNLDYQNPMDLWRDAMVKAPNNPRAHHNYAFILAEAGFTDEAIRQYDISVKLAPNMPLFLSNYGTLLGKLGRHSEAFPLLRSAVLLDPTNYKFILNLGVLHWQKGSLDNAVACFQEAIKVDPNASMSYYGLASVMLAKDNPLKAHELILKAIRLEPVKPLFHFQHGLILLKLGDLPGARAEFKSAIDLEANPESMISEVGWAFHEYGMDQESISNLRRALSRNPDHVRSRIRLGWVLSTSPDDAVRNGSEALLLAKNLIGSYPSPSPELLDLLGVALAESGRFQEAQAEIHLALSRSKDGKETWVPDLQKRLALFEKGQPYRELPKRLNAINPPEQNLQGS